MKGVSDGHRFALAEQEARQAGRQADGTAHGCLLTELSRIINYTDGRTLLYSKYWDKRLEEIRHFPQAL